MLFNSIGFALFFPVVFALYWAVPQRYLRAQNLLLLLASCFFYACWDPRFLGLLLFSTLLDHYTGLRVGAATDERVRRAWFWLSVSVNLGFLGVFKYYDFFAVSFAEGLARLGLKADPCTLNVVLPVGISFYTFHGLSYVIDIYKRRITPERDLVTYALFVSFFPLLVAGPIERATHLLPQIKRPRTFNYARAVDGARQALWGLFKKVVIADTCAGYADAIFNAPEGRAGSTLLLGAVFFAFQIYCDFSGYSDIALGTARLLGIELLRNFAFPYFSRDIAEFWRRWHISLSTWFRDYLYIPLGGSRAGRWKKVRNTFIIFLVSGFWHGANWTFLAWGFLNALYIMPSVVRGANREHLDIVARGRLLPTPREAVAMALTFALTVFAWIFFRAPSIGAAFSYVHDMLSASLFTIPDVRPSALFAGIAAFMAVEWAGREGPYALAGMGNALRAAWMRWAAYLLLLACILFFAGKEQQFIYFQF